MQAGAEKNKTEALQYLEPKGNVLLSSPGKLLTLLRHSWPRSVRTAARPFGSSANPRFNPVLDQKSAVRTRRPYTFTLPPTFSRFRGTCPSVGLGGNESRAQILPLQQALQHSRLGAGDDSYFRNASGDSSHCGA